MATTIVYCDFVYPIQIYDCKIIFERLYRIDATLVIWVVQLYPKAERAQ